MSADSTRRTLGSAPMDPLMHLVIHGQDVARPLGRRYVSPSGVRLVSTDTGWTAGDGAELRGPDVDLLLVAAGRRAGPEALDGPGTAVVAERPG